MEQILAEHYPIAYSDTEASHSQVSSAQPYRQQNNNAVKPATSNGIRRNIPLTTNGTEEQIGASNGTQVENTMKNVPFIDGNIN